MALTVRELHKDYTDEESRRNKIYGMVYTKCCNKITVISYKKKEECIFEVPEFTIGIPRYDLDHCLCYLIKRLRENGFYVRYIPNNIIYISWQNGERNKKRTEVKKFIKDEKKKTKDIIPLLSGYLAKRLTN